MSAFDAHAGLVQSGKLRQRIVVIPILGSIPAGFARDRRQEDEGCLSIGGQSASIKTTPRTFALEVRGDSMIGQHIVAGDFVVLKHGMTPRPGDVVAVYIDNESTLRTFVMENGKPHLRAENPLFSALIPAQDLISKA